MKNKIRFSSDSLNDLDEIWEYILVELENPSAAQNVISDILDCIDKLEEFSQIGAPLSYWAVLFSFNSYIKRFLIFRAAFLSNIHKFCRNLNS